jgi:predicted metal-dependent hydrolase
VPRIPDDLVIAPAEAARLGAQLLAEDRPFHAHEVFEAAWKSLAGPDRELWRGLAQIAVGLTHARRGNTRGAVALLRRGTGHVAEFASTGASASADREVDADLVVAQASAIADRIERDGLGDITAADLRLKLRPDS